MFKWVIKNDKIAQNAIFLEDSKGQEGRPFKSRFLQAGLVKYDFGVCLLQKETIDKFVNTFIECPVIIDHSDTINPETVKGRINKVWFSPEDGWFWCEGIITDEEAIKLIEDGYNVSCQYRITNYEYNTEEKLHNGNPYDIEILAGVFEHLAIVKKPRYEGAFIAVNAYMADDAVCRNGGEGSGNFDHDGRPGEVGGSAPTGEKSSKSFDEKLKDLEPVKIDKASIPQFETKKELYEWVKDIFKNLGKVTIKDTGIEVVLTSSSANRETVKKRSTREENKAVFQDFKQVVETSIKKDDRPKDERHTHNQELYINKFELDDELYEVELAIDYLEPNKEYRYAGHKVNKIAPSSTQASNALQTAGAINSVTDLNKIFNPKVNKYEPIFEWIRTYNTGGTMDKETKNLFSSLIEALTARNEADDEDDKEKEAENKAKNEDTDKRKLIDEVGGILKDKVDEELWRTIIGKIEKIAYDKSEVGAADNKAKNEDEEDKKECDKEAENKAKNENEDKLYDELKDKVEKAAENKKAKNSIDDAVNRLYSALSKEPEVSYMSEKKGLELGKQIYG